MKAALCEFRRSPSHLTSIHYLFIKQCLLAKCYDEARNVLDNVINNLDVDVSYVQELS
jgi:hypothetical protein